MNLHLGVLEMSHIFPYSTRFKKQKFIICKRFAVYKYLDIVESNIVTQIYIVFHFKIIVLNNSYTIYKNIEMNCL